MHACEGWCLDWSVLCTRLLPCTPLSSCCLASGWCRWVRGLPGNNHGFHHATVPASLQCTAPHGLPPSLLTCPFSHSLPAAPPQVSGPARAAAGHHPPALLPLPQLAPAAAAGSQPRARARGRHLRSPGQHRHGARQRQLRPRGPRSRRRGGAGRVWDPAICGALLRAALPHPCASAAAGKLGPARGRLWCDVLACSVLAWLPNGLALHEPDAGMRPCRAAGCLTAPPGCSGCRAGCLPRCRAHTGRPAYRSPPCPPTPACSCAPTTRFQSSSPRSASRCSTCLAPTRQACFELCGLAGRCVAWQPLGHIHCSACSDGGHRPSRQPRQHGRTPSCLPAPALPRAFPFRRLPPARPPSAAAPLPASALPALIPPPCQPLRPSPPPPLPAFIPPLPPAPPPAPQQATLGRVDTVHLMLLGLILIVFSLVALWALWAAELRMRDAWLERSRRRGAAAIDNNLESGTSHNNCSGGASPASPAAEAEQAAPAAAAAHASAAAAHAAAAGEGPSTAAAAAAVAAVAAAEGAVAAAEGAAAS